MMIDSDIREKVRQRAGFACEFCGITEADCGGYLSSIFVSPAFPLVMELARITN